MKHTQGKWQTNYNHATRVWEVYPTTHGLGRVCTITNRDSNEQEANAKLIAAAPELLEAVREFVEVCSYIRDAGNDDDPVLVKAIDAGHAAIDSATP